MSQAATVSRQIAQYGAAYTLRRAAAAAGANEWTRGAETISYYPCMARERGYKPDEVRGAIIDGDVLIVVDPASLAIEPKAGDQIALGTFADDAGADWRRIVSPPYAPREAGAVAAYRLQARK